MIYRINSEILKERAVMERYIYDNMEMSYYWSDDFSTACYKALAQAGFITIGTLHEGRELLLPEMQQEYALLDFANLHISKKVRALQKKERFYLSTKRDVREVITGLRAQHSPCWIYPRYATLLERLQQHSGGEFILLVPTLEELGGKEAVAGEIGYITRDVYTSLSGFCKKERQFNHCGKLQMVLLAQMLEASGVRFWNMGHPYMQYKFDLGAKVYDRREFLCRFMK